MVRIFLQISDTLSLPIQSSSHRESCLPEPTSSPGPGPSVPLISTVDVIEDELEPYDLHDVDNSNEEQHRYHVPVDAALPLQQTVWENNEGFSIEDFEMVSRYFNISTIFIHHEISRPIHYFIRILVTC